MFLDTTEGALGLEQASGKVEIWDVVELDKSDMKMLQESGPHHAYNTLKHTRAIHHSIAMMLAAGLKIAEIARTVSLHPATIRQLQDQPLFQELLEGYQEQVQDKLFDMSMLMSSVGTEAMTALLERLSDDRRDEISTRDLTSISVEYADRLGHSPVRRTESTNRHTHGLDPEILAKLRESLREDSVEANFVSTPVVGPEKEAAPSQESNQERITSAIRALSEGPGEGTETKGPDLREELCEDPYPSDEENPD